MAMIRLEGNHPIDYEHKMCLYGQPPHIGRYQLVTMAEGCEITFYQGYVLWTEDDNTVISVEQLVKLVLAMLGAMESCDHYLLNVRRLQLSLASAHLDEGGHVRFIYLPFESETCDDVHHLVTGFIQELQRVSDSHCERSLSILQGLTIALSEAPFDLGLFRQSVTSMLGETL